MMSSSFFDAAPEAPTLLPVELFAVYDHPRDFPEHYAVRKLFTAEDGLRQLEWVLFAHLEAARSMLASRGLLCVPRGETDEPELVETWV
jgi:hypothetical protein